MKPDLIILRLYTELLDAIDRIPPDSYISVVLKDAEEYLKQNGWEYTFDQLKGEEPVWRKK